MQTAGDGTPHEIIDLATADEAKNPKIKEYCSFIVILVIKKGASRDTQRRGRHSVKQTSAASTELPRPLFSCTAEPRPRPTCIRGRRSTGGGEAVHIKPQRAMQTLDLQRDRRQGRCPSDSVTKLSTQGNFDLDSPLLNAYNASTDAGRVRRPYSLTDRPSCAAGRAADSSRPSFSRGKGYEFATAPGYRSDCRRCILGVWSLRIRDAKHEKAKMLSTQRWGFLGCWNELKTWLACIRCPALALSKLCCA
eukprot:6175798-Pleurochrysis_carterae.AAC.1